MAYPIPESEALSLRSSESLAQLRQKANTVFQSALFPGQPETLWPVFAFTDLLNQTVGMQETTNSYLTRETGSTWMHAETKNAGLAVAYEELPFEWEAPHHYQVERIHSKGPLKYLCFEVELQAENPGQTRVTCRIHFVSILPSPVARLLINKEITRFMQSFEKLAAELATGTPALKAYFEPVSKGQAQTEAWNQQWQDIVPDAGVRHAIADYIARAPERLAYRLRPFELAEAYALDPLEVLKACLQLSRQGFLHLMWDCRCPGCKGPKESFQSLSALTAMAYCPTCAVNYGLAFDQNLELTFQPDSALRPCRERYFCAGSPGNTPHISWQHNLAANQTRHFELTLPAGAYVFRSLSCTHEYLVVIADEAPPGSTLFRELHLDLSGELKGPAEDAGGLFLAPGARLTVHNHNHYEISLMLENVHWQSQAVTAARVQAVQAFHDLFPDELLAPGESLPLSAQIFLQAGILNADDLRQAGALEHSETDDSSPADPCNEIQTWLRTRIQQAQGAVLPWGETGLRGIFASPFEAVSAAWALQQELNELNILYPLPVQLGLGLARGACEVSVIDKQFSYTGPVCEQVARAVELSAGQGLVVSESLLQGPEMQVFLQDPLMKAQFLSPSDQDASDSERWVQFILDDPFGEWLR